MPAQAFKLKNFTFTFWDSIKVENVKLHEIIGYYKTEYDIDIDDITVGQARFYSSTMPERKKALRLKKTITEIFKEVIEETPSISPIMLTLLADGDQELPPCKVYF